MIRLDDPTTAVRRTLRLLRRPHLLERDQLAQRVRQALGANRCRDGLVQLIDRVFADFPDGERLREILIRCDLGAQKARASAGAMHLSLRQFYRCRAEAIAALTVAIERLGEVQVLTAPAPAPTYCANCYQRIVAGH